MSALLIVLAVAYGAYKYANEAKGREVVVEIGDTVYVNYTGWLYDYRIYESARVFDTTYPDVVKDNKTYPKTVSFDFERRRGEPFKFKVGEGEVIKGWDKRIIGMKVGEKARWVIPPSEAYEPYLNELVVNISVYEHWQVIEKMEKYYFESKYGCDAEEGMHITHYFWGWNATVLGIENNDVLIQNVPEVGKEYMTKYGWKCVVLSINQSANGGDGDILIENNPVLGQKVSTRDVTNHFDNLKYIIDKQRKYQGGMVDGIVVGISDENITVDFNNEVYGKTLIFDVVVVNIEKS